MTDTKLPTLGRKILLPMVCAAMGTVAAPVLQAQTVLDPRIKAEIFFEGPQLKQPTSFDFIGVERILIMERVSGLVRLIEPGKDPVTVLDLDTTGEVSSGALGLAVHPDFPTSPFVFIYYSLIDDEGEWTEDHLVRYRFRKNRLTRPKILLRIKRKESMPNNLEHHGGYIRFGPDGYLYGQVGDFHRGTPGSLGTIESNTSDNRIADAGGIWRLSARGRVPADNPFATHPMKKLRKWFVYGIRSGFGMDFDPRSGDLWFSDNGPATYDELNRAVPGMNSGWRRIVGPQSRNQGISSMPGGDVNDLTELPGSAYRDPEFSWFDTIGVTGVVFLTGNAFPDDLRDRLVVTDFNTGRLYLFELRGDRERLRLPDRIGGDRVADTEKEVASVVWGRGFGAAVSMRMGPDGFLYVADTQGGRIIRVRPKN